jgi:hypothetical protein
MVNSDTPAWVIRCTECGGGMMWGLQSLEIRNILEYAFEDTGYPTTFETGALDLLCEIEYCECDAWRREG